MAGRRRSRRSRNRRKAGAGIFFLSLSLFAATVWICADALFGEAVCKLLTGRDSSGVRTVEVPALVGTPFTDGQCAAGDCFDVSVTYVYDPATPRQILSQEPPPHAHRKVLPGERKCALRLTVSLGEQMLPVPDVTGMEAREAEIALQRKGFSTSLLYGSSGGNAPDEGLGQRVGLDPRIGQVISTDPPAGEQVPVGTAVRIYASEEAEAASVGCPDLSDLPLDVAVRVLQSAGLTVGAVQEDSSAFPMTGFASAVVIAQDRLPDTWVPRGSAVGLTVRYAGCAEGGFWGAAF
jgi:beta-lactam-binding protein with PASTA domain